MFISSPHHGNYYIAEHSRKGTKHLLWSIMPVAPVAGDSRIKAEDVPYVIKRQAYRVFYRMRKEAECSSQSA